MKKLICLIILALSIASVSQAQNAKALVFKASSVSHRFIYGDWSEWERSNWAVIMEFTGDKKIYWLIPVDNDFQTVEVFYIKGNFNGTFSNTGQRYKGFECVTKDGNNYDVLLYYNKGKTRIQFNKYSGNEIFMSTLYEGDSEVIKE